MVQPIDSNLDNLDDYVEEIAEIVNDAREGGIAQILWRISDFGGKNSDWKPPEQALTDIKALFELIIKKMMTAKESFEVTVTHIRRATFVIELTIKIGKSKSPRAKKSESGHLKPVP